MENTKDLNTKPLSIKQYLIISSLLFALFFGAGNLIFPIHLGQLAGSNWISAALGFLCTGVLLPLLSVLAISITKSNGVYDIAKPLGNKFAIIFMILVHATLGPLFATPRTATVTFSVGFQPMIPAKYSGIALLIISALFFAGTYMISYKESNITKQVGKILNPIFLILLFIAFLLAFLHPMGNAGIQNITPEYKNASFFNGFLEGYNTMDALAGLAFGVTVVTAVKQLGKTSPKSNAKATAWAGILSEILVGIIYVILIWIGATSLELFKVAADGGPTFNQFMTHYLGSTGNALLATLLTLTCLTTAVGLVSAFAQDFHNHFPKVSYRQWLAINCGLSFIIANCGLSTIIQWSTPVLMLLYPYAIFLIILSIFSPLFKKDSIVYITTIICITIPAFMDMLASLPAYSTNNGFMQSIISFHNSYFPFASLGMDWVIPGIIGLFIGLIIHIAKKNK
ncbi:branched-chain amino acid transport protein [Apilactobacillus ozensis DSM 23829 = JCM 17196]|uniref:Branched-chain amino acid transport system carrier protein n=1 Tax=Apilactobacillus ozensis DSM 23829 = JCM 17196 TaxID=1423781 RepID=A0A0R2ASR8_9LACO|nr:branched-chain amino acid transport system II carrier protein [Apilactobacillus ozensis]KRM69743.1 branched-chain amino acid transport protein [Apilactobacillus ozensis DSM 23829 = JCM 17196]